MERGDVSLSTIVSMISSIRRSGRIKSRYGMRSALVCIVAVVVVVVDVVVVVVVLVFLSRFFHR